MKYVEYQHRIQLPPISLDRINTIDREYTERGGHNTADSLFKLFKFMNNHTNKYEVKIKVAALNSIYSTAIQHINPVVNKIVEVINQETNEMSEKELGILVDKIATAEWSSGKRTNLSFASKHIHFLSKGKIPIYDSYIWIVMTGYLYQYTNKNYSFDKPKKYGDFYERFFEFKGLFSGLADMTNYEIDKFLWQMGKNYLDETIERYKLKDRQSAKRKMIQRLRIKIPNEIEVVHIPEINHILS